MNTNNSRKRFAIIFLLLAFLIGIPLTVYVAQQQQSTQSKAATIPETTVVFTFNGQQYRLSDVRVIAEEYNDPSVVDNLTLRASMEALEERLILDKAAQDLGIVIDSAKVNELVAQDYSENDAKYIVLEDMVTLKAVRSREAISTGFWNPPVDELDSLTTIEREDAVNQLRDGRLALDEAQAALSAGTSLVEIANSILTKYPTLSPAWSVNGYIVGPMDQAERNESAGEVIVDFGDSGFDKETRDALFAMNVGEIRKVANTPDNRGGTVLKLIAKGSDTGETSYEVWLGKQKTLLVRELGVL